MPRTPGRTRSLAACQTSPVGFTLIEMLITIAVLVIGLILMISLAHLQRQTSADDLTRDLLRKLNVVMSQYIVRNQGRPPAITGFAPLAGGEERDLQSAARSNNIQFVRALKLQQDLSAGVFSALPISIYDEVNLRDAWGQPIVFMAGMHPLIGTAPLDKPFFFSAGPDRRYLTREDNLYSYEDAGVR